MKIHYPDISWLVAGLCLALLSAHAVLAQTSPATLPDLKLSRAGWVFAMVRQDDGKIIIGGHFESINGVPRSRIARLNADGSVDVTWDPNADATVFALAISGDDLYVGGQFTNIDGQYRSGLAKLSVADGRVDAAWVPAPAPAVSGGSAAIYAISLVGTNVYVGGNFLARGSTSTLTNLARFSPASAAIVDEGWRPNTDGDVLALALSGTSLYVGGIFTHIGGMSRHRVAKLSILGGGLPDPLWNADVETTQGNTAYGGVNALVVGASDVFIGGSFEFVGNTERTNVAKVSAVNGAVDLAWNADLDGRLSCLALVGTNLFLGGLFTHLRGGSYERLAKVNASGSGEPDPAWRVKLDSAPLVVLTNSNDTSLLVGGTLSFVNDDVSLGIAKIDEVSGARDASFGAQVQSPGDAWALARQPDGKIVFAGWFSVSGTVPRHNIARANQDGTLDTSWAPNIDGRVNDLALSGTNIFIGGEFTNAGGLQRNGLAKLTTTSDAPDPIWNPDPHWNSAPGGYVWRLAVADTNLFVAGYFGSIGGFDRDGLAKVSTVGVGPADPDWNPKLDPGALVDCFAVGSSNLFVGGVLHGPYRALLAKLSLGGKGDPDPLWNPGIINSSVLALALDGTNLLIGGDFRTVDGQVRNGLAKISASGAGALDAEWDPDLTNSFPGLSIGDIAVSSTNVYVMGVSGIIGGQRRVASARLSAMGRGLADPSWQRDLGGGAEAAGIALCGADLYAGGYYYDAMGVAHAGPIFLPVADSPVIYQDPANKLIIARNGADGLEVTHFRITDISGGTLFQGDGVTPINVGDFITAEQGNAGLRFIYAATNASIAAVSALNNRPEGAGSAATTVNFAAPPLPVFSFERASYSVPEDLGTLLALTVRKLRPGAATVSFAAQPGSADIYDSINDTGDFFVVGTNVLTFANSDTTKTIRIFINDDDLIEGDETFTVRLTGASGGIIAYPAVATVTVIDDECPGQHGSFTSTALPTSAPAATGALQVNVPEPATAQWRLAGDPVWRTPGSTATSLVPGFYEVVFKPVVGFRNPERVTVQIVAGSTATFSGLYASQATNAFGELMVLITPEAVATNANPAMRGRWRISGGEWQDSGASQRLIAGFYAVELTPVAGSSAPRTTVAQVIADQTVIRTAAYEPESGAGPVLPTVLSVNVVTSTPPYCYNGLIETEDGFGSGVVVKERVVLTAAHVLFDDTRLSYTKRVEWFLQKHRGDYEPIGQVPRGWYVFDGYAARRTEDDSPGISSPVSESFDAAAMFFVGANATENLPGRGGYSGFLSSASSPNEWLVSSRLKMLVGYPLEGMAETNQGRMHATTPANIPFTKPYAQINNQVYATTAIASRPGNSGGPVYVQADDGTYYPAGIYLGGGSQTLVRAIDEKVVCLINAAEVSGNGGGNNTGGGVALWSPGTTVDTFQVGLVRVTLGPTNAVRAGAAWRVNRGGGDVSPYLPSSDTVYPLIPGPIPIEFKPVPGFATPMRRIVQPVANSTVPVDVLYPAFDLRNPSWLAGGALRFTLTGATGRVYAIETSADLTNWSTLAMLTNQTGSLLFTNQPPANPPWRFYRGREE